MIVIKAQSLINKTDIAINKVKIEENRVAIEKNQKETRLLLEKADLDIIQIRLDLEKSQLEDIQNGVRSINTRLTEYNKAVLKIKDLVNASDGQLRNLEFKIYGLSDAFTHLINELDDSNVPGIPLRELIPNIMMLHAEVLSELSLYPTVDNIIEKGNGALNGYKRAYRVTDSPEWIEIEDLWNQALIKRRARYVLKVKTGTKLGAGTDGNVHFRFINETSSLLSFRVDKAGRNNPFRISGHTNLFERGHQDIFAFTGSDIFNDPSKVEIKLTRAAGFSLFDSAIDWDFDQMELQVLRVDGPIGDKKYVKHTFTTDPRHKRTIKKNSQVIFSLSKN